jgi:3-methylcrotonyl-CoA carboxylase beta subunit
MRLTLQKFIRNALVSSRRSYYNASVLSSHVSTTSPEFLAKAEAMNALVADLDAKMAEARLGGGTKAAERMKAKGKKLPRERSGILPSPFVRVH